MNYGEKELQQECDGTIFAFLMSCSLVLLIFFLLIFQFETDRNPVLNHNQKCRWTNVFFRSLCEIAPSFVRLSSLSRFLESVCHQPGQAPNGIDRKILIENKPIQGGEETIGFGLIFFSMYRNSYRKEIYYRSTQVKRWNRWRMHVRWIDDTRDRLSLLW